MNARNQPPLPLEFLSILSHELRNPIHAVQTNAWLIKSRTHDEDLVRPAEAIERQVQRLNGLLEDLLDAARLPHELQLERAAVSVQQLVVAAVEATEASVGLHRRELDVDLSPEPLFVEADGPRLTQALGNVLRNAVKYSPQQGEIRVTVRPEAGLAVISVRDQGLGIRAEELPAIFDLFTRSEAALRDTAHGLGLGLHVAREIVAAHGGTIEARSEGPGRGSEFVMRVPLTESRPAEHEPRREPGQVEAKLDVLVVDDHRDAADSLSSVLEAQGHRVRSAYDGVEALASIEAQAPHLALVDIGMPGMDGYELARRVAAGDSPRPVLVAVTGWGAPADKERAKAAGFDYHLTKPLDYAALGALVSIVARKLAT
jgi:CheY-like chemotaxis protein/anti-sigma regulatory factor (Ser/Thr protein kinase)